MSRTKDFMPFWKALNDFAKSRDLTEVLYGEASDRFEEMRARAAYEAEAAHYRSAA